jgi:hypothetical protein
VKRRGRSRYKLASIAVSVLVGGWIALSACSNQSEGERCDVANGDEDCKTDEGLVCFPKAQLSAPFNNADRCCPRDRSTAKTDPCKFPTNPIAGDSAPPGDTGPGPDVKVDAPTDSSDADAEAETSTDAADAADADGG